MSFGIPVRNGLAIGLLSSTTLSSRRGLSPAMYLNFLQPFLDPRITFSRGSNATLVDATGKITYAPNNLITYSTDATNAVWTKTNTTVAGGVSDPVGGTNAQTVTATTSAAQLYNFVSIGSAIGTKYLFSVWVRRRSGSGTVSLFNPNATPSAIAVTSTWTQFFVSSNGGSGFIYPGFLIGTSGDAIDIYFPVCAAITYETAPRSGDQVATTASAYYGPRFDYDPVTLAPKGLLIEEARTNLLLYSEQFDNVNWNKSGTTVTANATASPDGTSNADALVEDGTTGLHLAQQFFTFLNATAYTVSVYIKPSTRTWVQVLLPAAAFTASQGGFFNLSGVGSLGTVTGSPTSRSITAVGNGWYRITVTATSTAAAGGNIAIVSASADGTTSYAGTNGANALFLWGADLEAGASATSYIPTVASTVTRSADVATMTGTNFSSWYRQAEGTFMADFGGNGSYAFTAYDGTTNNFNAITLFGSGTVRSNSTTSGLSSVIDRTSNALGIPNKSAFAYKATDFAASTNGGAIGTNAGVGVPVVDRMAIGAFGGFGHLNGHIRQIAYYNTRLPNSQLQTLTAPSLATTLSLSFTNQAYTVGV